jgi:8-oxo-dGTP pyrophosphatase MutT (NUDIX family)
MAGFWAFPGGKEEPADIDAAAALVTGQHASHQRIPAALQHLVVTAQREFLEEVGAEVAPDGPAMLDVLVPAGHWITPRNLPRRYNTIYYLAHLPDATLKPDPNEVADARWWQPERYLQAAGDGSVPTSPPIIRTMIDLAQLDGTGAALRWAHALTISPVEPVLASSDSLLHVRFPGHPDHPETTFAFGAPWELRSSGGRWEW